MRKKSRRQLGATLAIIILTIVVTIVSYVLAQFDINGTKTVIVNNVLEGSVVNVKNIISVDGIRFMISSFTSNIKWFTPLAFLIVALISTGIIESSGILKKMSNSLRKINKMLFTMIIVFISIMFVFFNDYGFLILMPLVALIYKEMGRNPLLGLLTVFLATTVAYGSGLFINYNDLALGKLTELAARVSVDVDYTFRLKSYLYVKIVSSVVFTFLLTYFIEKKIAKKIPSTSSEVEELELLENETKALKISLLFLVLYLGTLIFVLIPNTIGSSLLLDMNEKIYTAKLFSSKSPFNEGAFMFILLGFTITSYIYGTLTKKYRDVKDFSSGFAKHFDGIGEMFVLIFFISQLFAVLEWTNIGELVAIRLTETMHNLDFSGLSLVLFLFFITLIIGLFITSTITKWEYISPLGVPLFMRSNFTPEFAQTVFRAADGVSKTITPLFPYYIILLGFVKKYNRDRALTLFGTMRLIMPAILVSMLFWVIILLGFYMIGLPIGPNSSATF